MLTEENLEKVEVLINISGRLDTDLASVSLAWALRKSAISCLITGATIPEQLENNLKALAVEITPEIEQEIDALFEFIKFNRKNRIN